MAGSVVSSLSARLASVYASPFAVCVQSCVSLSVGSLPESCSGIWKHRDVAAPELPSYALLLPRCSGWSWNVCGRLRAAENPPPCAADAVRACPRRPVAPPRTICAGVSAPPHMLEPICERSPHAELTQHASEQMLTRKPACRAYTTCIGAYTLFTRKPARRDNTKCIGA